MAAVMASKGHMVIGVDVNPAYVRAIQQGKAPISETGLAGLIEANRERLSATTSYDDALLASDVTFIIVPTPSEPDGTFSMRFVRNAAERIGAALRRKAAWHLVVLSSTVMPGAAVMRPMRVIGTPCATAIAASLASAAAGAVNRIS